MTVLRRLDCVLAPTEKKVLEEYERLKDRLPVDPLEARLNNVAGERFHNPSSLDFEKLKGDTNRIAQHLMSYIEGFAALVSAAVAGQKVPGGNSRPVGCNQPVGKRTRQPSFFFAE